MRQAPGKSNVWYSQAVETTEFWVLDIETAGGVWDSFPDGFDLLMTGLDYGSDSQVFTATAESLGSLADSLDAYKGTIVTYNGTSFDLPILKRYFAKVLSRPLKIHYHYDLLREIYNKAGRRISLDKVCYYSFGERKMPWDHRRNRQVWEENPELLIKYNQVDLELTSKLYERVLANKPLFLGDSTVVLPLPQKQLRLNLSEGESHERE